MYREGAFAKYLEIPKIPGMADLPTYVPNQFDGTIGQGGLENDAKYHIVSILLLGFGKECVNFSLFRRCEVKKNHIWLLLAWS